MSAARRLCVAAMIIAVAAGCQFSNLGTNGGGSGFTLALPWDTSANPSHEIFCAYNGEGITSAGRAGQTSGCGHHVNGPSGYTQDGDALDFDLHSGKAVLSVDSGTVRWANAYSSSSSWSCYGNSVAIDTMLGDGSVVTALYAHLDSIRVSSGQQVSQGQEIATSGASGGGTNQACPSAYGPHLHFALYTNVTYTTVGGASVPAVALWATGTGGTNLVTSPPYGGSARIPEPWLDCARSSTLSTPPAGEDGSCTDLHAGDVLSRAG